LQIFREVTTQKKYRIKIKTKRKNTFVPWSKTTTVLSPVLDENLKTIFRSVFQLQDTADEFRQMPDVEYFHPDYLEYMQQEIQKTLSNPDIPNPVSLIKIKMDIYG
jgi:hypothetical protein